MISWNGSRDYLRYLFTLTSNRLYISSINVARIYYSVIKNVVVRETIITPPWSDVLSWAYFYSLTRP